MAEEPPSTELDEHRGSPRSDLSAPVRVHIEATVLEGQSENVSSAGILVFTDQPLEVTIEIDADEGNETRRGRLVRVQRMTETNTGLAIEFDS